MAEARKLKVFLCHSSGDKATVRDLYKRLRTDGIEPWLDEEELLPGQNWQQEIAKAVRVTDAIVVCLSRASSNKEGFVQKEIKYALDAADEKPEGTIFVIPLRLEDCSIPERLQHWHVGNLFEERGYERLIRALQIRANGLGFPGPQAGPAREIRNSIGMELILIPAGEFLMGAESKDADDDERPVRRVHITRPFYIGKYPVTQVQWQTVMGNNPSHFTGDLNRPVESVSWEEAQEFLRTLNEQEKGKLYRLPTEAEWEYAARAGSTAAYCFGDEVKLLREYAWYGENSGNSTHPVGQLKPNAWGLYDVHGNVWEWVQDWYAEDYYQRRPNPDRDPQGPQKGQYRSVRGGSWDVNRGTPARLTATGAGQATASSISVFVAPSSSQAFLDSGFWFSVGSRAKPWSSFFACVILSHP